MYVCVCMCMYVCMYACVCVHYSDLFAAQLFERIKTTVNIRLHPVLTGPFLLSVYKILPEALQHTKFKQRGRKQNHGSGTAARQDGKVVFVIIVTQRDASLQRNI